MAKAIGPSVACGCSKMAYFSQTTWQRGGAPPHLDAITYTRGISFIYKSLILDIAKVSRTPDNRRKIGGVLVCVTNGTRIFTS